MFQQVKSSSAESRIFSHEFPLMDFKFVNTGNATAALTAFEVIILSSDVDVTPYPEFSWEVPHTNVCTAWGLWVKAGSGRGCEFGLGSAAI